MLKQYTIAPLRPERRKEIVQRLRKHYADKIFTDVLFSIYVVPEGNPPFDKAADCTEAFRAFQKDLTGIPVGILVNSLFGHGADRLCSPNPFQKQIGMDPQNDFRLKERIDVCCPLDSGFQEYAVKQFRRLASLNPHVLMLDDDFRVLLPVYGCLCPLHIKMFNERFSFSVTAEELVRHLVGIEPEDIEIAHQFEEINTEALNSMMRIIREAIDSVNPDIRGIECGAPNEISHLERNARIFAGAHYRPEVRIGNARYLQQGNRNFPGTMHMTMLQKGLLSPDVTVLSETDTFPHTRYSMGARELHATYTGHLLEGCTGSKQWIMRLEEEETASEKAYAAILAKYSAFYGTVAELIPKVRFSGPANLFPGHMPFPWNPPRHLQEIQSWSTILIGRMGLPVNFRKCGDGPGMLTVSEIPFYSDEEIRSLLEQGAILDGGAALALTKRGFESFMGVSVQSFPPGQRSMEEQIGEHPLCSLHAGALMSPPAGQVMLTPLTEKTEVISWFVKTSYMRHPVKQRQTPAVTLFQNAAGGKVAVFASNPNGLRGMAYFNETRKMLLAAVMNAIEPMAVYYPGDAEIYLKSGWLDTKTIFTVLFNLGSDPLDEIELAVANKIAKIRELLPDGTFQFRPFKQDGRQCSIQVQLETMLPLVFLIEYTESCKKNFAYDRPFSQ